MACRTLAMPWAWFPTTKIDDDEDEFGEDGIGGDEPVQLIRPLDEVMVALVDPCGPRTEHIVGDEQAASFFAREQRKGYEIQV